MVKVKELVLLGGLLASLGGCTGKRAEGRTVEIEGEKEVKVERASLVYVVKEPIVAEKIIKGRDTSYVFFVGDGVVSSSKSHLTYSSWEELFKELKRLEALEDSIEAMRSYRRTHPLPMEEIKKIVRKERELREEIIAKVWEINLALSLRL